MSDGRLVGLSTRLSARGAANKVLYSYEFFFFFFKVPAAVTEQSPPRYFRSRRREPVRL